MFDNSQLSTSTSLGDQSTTQNPQASTDGSLAGNKTSQIQPVSADSLAANQTGIPLIVNSLPAVNLTNTTASKVVAKPVINHRPNMAYLSISALLLIAAIVMFWSFSRQAKNTTE